MKFAKKLIFLATALAMLGSSASSLNADECYVDNTVQCCPDNSGCAYDQCCASSNLAPAIALGTIAVIAIVAIAVQDSSSHHHHTHSH